MAMYNENGNWSADASVISSGIHAALKPFLDEALAKGMTYSDFYFIVGGEAELLILEDKRHKQEIK